jgi:pentatricopeptide repeat protein
MNFLQVSCHIKLKNYHKAIQMLNEMKRNQMNRKIKLKALQLRMQVYRKIQKYDESLRDARCLQALMDHR